MNVLSEMKSKKVKDLVLRTLATIPETRDDDRKLIAHVWITELQKETIVYDPIYALFAGIVSNPESIRRMRQLLQNKHENLRGHLWFKRKKLGKAVSKEILDEIA